MKDFSPLAITDAVVGFPARVCVLTRLDGTVLRFAESDEQITIDGDVYSIVPGLAISAVKHTSDGEMPSCEIAAIHKVGGTFDTDDVNIGLYDSASVLIYIVDRMDLSRKGLLFTGSIDGINYNVENQVLFDVKGLSLGARVLMTQKRSPMCRTDLFSTLCGVDKTLYDQATTIATIVDSFTFTVTGALAQATGWFNQGFAVTAAGKGLDISSWDQATQTIVTYLPTRLAVGLALTLYPGCDKTLGAAGCPKFSNQLNFQGEPHFLGTAAAAQQV